MMKTILIFVLLYGIFTIELFANSYLRDDQANIVLDTTTNLMWQDTQAVQEVEKPWGEAINYCEELVLGGYDDWRLPNSFELNSIVDRTKFNPVLNDAFIYPNISINNVFWSSTSKYGYNANAWPVEFTRGTFSGYYIKDDGNYSYLGTTKDTPHFIRCVRNVKK